MEQTITSLLAAFEIEQERFDEAEAADFHLRQLDKDRVLSLSAYEDDTNPHPVFTNMQKWNRKRLKREIRAEQNWHLQQTPPDPFVGLVIIEDRKAAITYASQEYSVNAGDRRSAFWVDASVKPKRFNEDPASGAGVAVVYKEIKASLDWVEKEYPVYQENISSNQAKALAIVEALRIALSDVEKRSTVEIYSDSHSALKKTWDFRPGSSSQDGLILRKIIAYSISLEQLGSQLILRWVPAHSRVPGNVRADFAARQAARCKERDENKHKEMKTLICA